MTRAELMRKYDLKTVKDLKELERRLLTDINNRDMEIYNEWKITVALLNEIEKNNNP